MTIANILVTPCATERSLREYKDDYLEEKVRVDLPPPLVSGMNYSRFIIVVRGYTQRAKTITIGLRQAARTNTRQGRRERVRFAS